MPIIKTNQGRTKLSKAHAGEIQLSPITHIAFGSGGVVAGTPRALSGEEDKMFNEIIRKQAIISHPDEFTTRYSATINAYEDKIENMTINEAAIFDKEGTMISIKTFRNKEMENGVSFEFYYDAEY